MDGFDAQAVMAEINRLPHFCGTVDGTDLHWIHLVGEAGGKRPLLLAHGWPGTFYECSRGIEPLAFRAATAVAAGTLSTSCWVWFLAPTLECDRTTCHGKTMRRPDAETARPRSLSGSRDRPWRCHRGMAELEHASSVIGIHLSLFRSRLSA